MGIWMKEKDESRAGKKRNTKLWRQTTKRITKENNDDKRENVNVKNKPKLFK